MGRPQAPTGAQRASQVLFHPPTRPAKTSLLCVFPKRTMEHPRTGTDEEEKEGCLAYVQDAKTWITLPRASVRRGPATRSDLKKRTCMMDRRRNPPRGFTVELREVPLVIQTLQYVKLWMRPRRGEEGRRRGRRCRCHWQHRADGCSAGRPLGICWQSHPR